MAEQRIDDGGAAFPESHDQSGEWRTFGGMSLRDYFAAHAPNRQEYPARDFYKTATSTHRGPGVEPEALRRYRYADDMIVARQPAPASNAAQLSAGSH